MALSIVKADEKAIVLDDAAKARARQMFFPDVPDDVLNVVWLYCEMYRINPFAKHIVVLKFWNKKKSAYDYTPYITRDGVVAHAQETGLISAIQVQHGVELATGEKYCTVSVYRKDSSRAYTNTYFMSEWQPKSDGDERGSKFWRDMPRNMLAKTAIRHAVLQVVPLSIPVLDENSAYFNAVMKNISGVLAIDEPTPLPELPAPTAEPVETVDPATLVDTLADPVIEGESVPETPAPSVDSDTLEKARVDVAIMGEDVFTPDVWKIKKASLIRGIKSDATTLEDLNLEELARLTATITAVKMGNGGNRRL